MVKKGPCQAPPRGFRVWPLAALALLAMLALWFVWSRKTDVSENDSEISKMKSSKGEVFANDRAGGRTSKTLSQGFAQLGESGVTMDGAKRLLAEHWDGSFESTVAILKELPPSPTFLGHIRFELGRSFVKKFPKQSVGQSYAFLRSDIFKPGEVPDAAVAAILAEVAMQKVQIDDPVGAMADFTDLIHAHGSDPAIDLATDELSVNYTGMGVAQAEDSAWKRLIMNWLRSEHPLLKRFAYSSIIQQLAVDHHFFGDYASATAEAGPQGIASLKSFLTQSHRGDPEALVTKELPESPLKAGLLAEILKMNERRQRSSGQGAQ